MDACTERLRKCDFVMLGNCLFERAYYLYLHVVVSFVHADTYMILRGKTYTPQYCIRYHLNISGSFSTHCVISVLSFNVASSFNDIIHVLGGPHYISIPTSSVNLYKDVVIT